MINIIEANYSDSMCSLIDGIEIWKQKCNDKDKCEFNSTNIYGKACGNAGSVLRVKGNVSTIIYERFNVINIIISAQCLTKEAFEELPRIEKEVLIHHGDTNQIQCQNGKEIDILYGHFGKSTVCDAIETKMALGSLCNGQKKCRIDTLALTAQSGTLCLDDTPDTTKQLHFKYTCRKAGKFFAI